MSTSFPSLFPGMLLDSASRYAQDHADRALQGDPVRELGWTATLVPEEAGGVGGGLSDLASIVEGLATHGLQLPVVETCAVVPLLLQAAGAETAGRWLEAVAEGSAQVAPLTALSGMPDDTALAARHLDIGYELGGTVQGVDVTLPASHYLVPARVDGEDDLLHDAAFVQEILAEVFLGADGESGGIARGWPLHARSRRARRVAASRVQAWIAASRLDGSARPLPAMSSAVPWSTATRG